METEVKDTAVQGTETLQTIYDRRAVRKYKERLVDHKIIEKIIDAGRMAPSAMNRQEWRFYVLTNKDTIKAFSREIANITTNAFVKSAVTDAVKNDTNLLRPFYTVDRLKGFDPIFHGAPVVIFITAPKDNNWGGIDVGMCAQNMMLAAKALGLDSCPVGLARYVEQTNIYHRLKVTAAEKIELAVILGYGDETPELRPIKKDNLVFIDQSDNAAFRKAILL